MHGIIPVLSGEAKNPGKFSSHGELVRMGRLELPRVTPLEPKSSASTSFATFAVPQTDVPRAGGIIRESGCGEQMRRSARPAQERPASDRGWPQRPFTRPTGTCGKCRGRQEPRATGIHSIPGDSRSAHPCAPAAYTPSLEIKKTAPGSPNAVLCFDKNHQTVQLSTRSRSSLPGLKCGTCLSGTCTESPVFGFLPTRGGR